MKGCEVLCVVTGMEQSGTTFFSKLLVSNPKIMCGFECGILLDDISNYHKVEPWYKWMQETTDIGHWGILPENMKKICDAENYYEAYSLIKEYAGDVEKKQVKECFQKATYIIDKTPGYLPRDLI